MVLCSLRMVQLWELIRLGSMPKGIAIYEENSSFHNHKDIKRNKQHFWFLYNKTFFKGYCLYLATKEITKMYRVEKRLHKIHLFGWKGQKERKGEISLIWIRLISPFLSFRWYKGDNNGFLLQTHWLSGLFSRLCWQNYLDSQRFYFHLLVLIGPARFNKSFLRCLVSLSDHSNVCFPSGLLSSLLPTAYME